MAKDGAKKLSDLVKKKRKATCCDSCSGSERERRYGTESDNQYVPPNVQVLPIPPPYVPPDFDGMYKMRTLYTKRLDDVNSAINRARAQVRLYDQLRQDTLGTTTGVGGVIAQALGTVDNLEQLRDSVIPGRRIYTDRHITRNTVANAYNSVMAQAGLTPEPTAGVTKSVLIDRIIDAASPSPRSHDANEDASRRIKLDP
ncbi:hypothetical protein AB1Y20_007300 [Prymnesium parvum]|uniref:Uncharacterized protein n=1 Tax=Prymnesium parvum TaxID=97485 RepID=A0AB34IUE9_PRYPA